MKLDLTGIRQNIQQFFRGSPKEGAAALRKLLDFINDLSPGATGGRRVDATAAALTITQDLHDGKTIALNRAAGGVTVTLPKADGYGGKYRFRVVTALSSGNYIVKVANSTDVFRGTVLQSADAGNAVVAYDTAATDDTITLNGSTAGGLPGDYLEFETLKADFWEITAITVATGAEASPLSASV